MCADITYRGMKFFIAEYVYDISKSTLMVSIKNFIDLNYKRIFKNTTLPMEPKFEPMWDDIDNINGTPLNTNSLN